MPRRREVPKRDILPDPKYNSKLAAKIHERHHESGKEKFGGIHTLWCPLK